MVWRKGNVIGVLPGLGLGGGGQLFVSGLWGLSHSYLVTSRAMGLWG